MTPRDQFIAALKRQPPTGRVPHFELEFFLTLEAVGRIHGGQQAFHQWDQMEEKERQLHREYIADTMLLVAEKYEHSAIMVHANPWTQEEIKRVLSLIREKSGGRYFLMMHGDATYSIPNGEEMLALSYRMADEPEKMKAEADEWVNRALAAAEKMQGSGLDGFALCADYCLNTGPFMSPSQFSDFVTPYLAKLIRGYRDLGFYTIKHTDGQIMPIIDQLVQTRPDALHSIDPQAGVDIAEVKCLYGDQVCLIGNVNCGMLDTGTDDEVVASARYALMHGMPGGGYVFSTSNCIYTGMRLARYELMLDVWRKEGNYPQP